MKSPKKDTVIDALESMFTIQRWNFMPRIETWVEAENAAYVAHVAYAIGRASNWDKYKLECVVLRSLLKSLNKYYLTDISLDVVDKIKKDNADNWKELIDNVARGTAQLFPRKISNDILIFLEYSPKYENHIKGKLTQQDDHDIENLVKFSQRLVAKEECETNSKVYSEQYKDIIEKIESRMDRIPNCSEYKKIYERHQKYFLTIKNLKYLRRWNRINRIISTNVLGHTFVVSFLAIILSLQSLRSEDKFNNSENPLYEVVLRSLFHDVPESLTGDIITPVKKRINQEMNDILNKVEADLKESFIKSAPTGVKEDIENYDLLTEISNEKIYSVESMVKDCDRLSAVLECLYEKASGIIKPEIEFAYEEFLQELAKSEWTSVLHFLQIIKESLSK